MNNKGISVLIGIVFAVMIFITGMIFVNYFFDDVTLATGTTQMDCDNTAISDGAKLTCLGLDAVIPYFMLLVMGAAGGIIASKVLG